MPNWSLRLLKLHVSPACGLALLACCSEFTGTGVGNDARGRDAGDTAPAADGGPESDASSPPAVRASARPITSEGTTQTAGSLPRFVATLPSGTLFFADDGVHGTELWRSDGTQAGTQLVRDIVPGTAGVASHSSRFAVIDGVAYGVLDDGAHGVELWRSNGTAEGTALVVDSVAGRGSLPYQDVGVFRAGANLCHGQPGAANRPRLRCASTSGVTTSSNLLDVRAMVEHGGLLYVGIESDAQRRIVSTDGVVTTTVRNDVTLEAGFSSGTELVWVESGLATGRELGTPSGTWDLEPGSFPGLTGAVAPLGTRFLAGLTLGTRGVHVVEAGVPAPLGAVEAPLPYEDLDAAVLQGNFALAVVRATSTSARSLVRFDPAEPSIVETIRELGDCHASLAPLAGRTLLAACEPGAAPAKRVLYSTDGTAAGTVVLAPEVVVDPLLPTGTTYGVLGGTTATSGGELCLTDGTPAGTTLLDMNAATVGLRLSPAISGLSEGWVYAIETAPTRVALGVRPADATVRRWDWRSELPGREVNGLSMAGQLTTAILYGAASQGGGFNTVLARLQFGETAAAGASFEGKSFPLAEGFFGVDLLGHTVRWDGRNAPAAVSLVAGGAIPGTFRMGVTAGGLSLFAMDEDDAETPRTQLYRLDPGGATPLLDAAQAQSMHGVDLRATEEGVLAATSTGLYRVSGDPGGLVRASATRPPGTLMNMLGGRIFTRLTGGGPSAGGLYELTDNGYELLLPGNVRFAQRMGERLYVVTEDEATSELVFRVLAAEGPPTELARGPGDRSAPTHTTAPWTDGTHLYFAFGDTETGEELWRSDGTTEGTVRLIELSAGTRSSDPRVVGRSGEELVVWANDYQHGYQLFSVREL